MRVLILAVLLIVASAQLSKVVPEQENDVSQLKVKLVEDFKQLVAAKKQFKEDFVKFLQFEQSIKEQAEDFLPKKEDKSPEKIVQEMNSLFKIHWGQVADIAGHVGEAIIDACEDICDDLADAAGDAGR